jgi:hypothetical protein
MPGRVGGEHACGCVVPACRARRAIDKDYPPRLPAGFGAMTRLRWQIAPAVKREAEEDWRGEATEKKRLCEGESRRARL